VASNSVACFPEVSIITRMRCHVLSCIRTRTVGT
jgi:hypothetical protein